MCWSWINLRKLLFLREEGEKVQVSFFSESRAISSAPSQPASHLHREKKRESHRSIPLCPVWKQVDILPFGIGVQSWAGARDKQHRARLCTLQDHQPWLMLLTDNCWQAGRRCWAPFLISWHPPGCREPQDEPWVSSAQQRG